MYMITAADHFLARQRKPMVAARVTVIHFLMAHKETQTKHFGKAWLFGHTSPKGKAREFTVSVSLAQ
jgi:hypothetical protein